MGIGGVSIVTSQKREQAAGPPFNVAAANNGDSVDTVTGKIVLGNDVGQAGSPAQLLSNREIITGDALTGPFTLLLNDQQNLATSNIGSGLLTLDETGGNINATMNIKSSSGIGAAILDLFNVTNNTDFAIVNNGGNAVQFVTGGLNVSSYSTLAPNTVQIGAPLVAFNSAALQVTGGLTYRRFIQSPGNITINRDLDSGKLFFNTAVTTLTTPNVVGANFRAGLNFDVAITNAAGITVQLTAPQVALFGNTATSAGGTLSSVTVGSTLRLTLINQTTWVTNYFTGVWVLT